MIRFSLWIIVYSLEFMNLNTSAEPTLNVLKTGKDYFCVLANDTLDSAIYWGHQDDDEYQSNSNTVFCDILKNSKCQLRPSNAWNKQEGMDSSPILDYRWESIKVEKIAYSPPKLVYEPQEKNFRISFSFKATEVHILLCDREFSTSYGKCYWIGINGNRTYLRKCEGSQIPTESNTYAGRPCNTTGVFNTKMKNLLDKNTWIHFTVSKMNNNIILWYYGLENILELQDKSSNPYDVTHVYVRTEGYDLSFMKLHKVPTLHSTKRAIANISLSPSTFSCLSLHVRICSSCSLQISTSNANGIVEKEVAHSTSRDWKRIVLENKLSDQIDTISLSAETKNPGNNNSFWFISSTIQKCHVNDLPLKKGHKGCCFALKYPQLTVCAEDFPTYKFEDTDFECPSDTIGRNCLPYTPFGITSYTNSKLCYTSPGNKIVCSCGAGYSQSTDCLQTCTSGTYGHNCKRQCGKCTNTCNRIDGSCKCKKNFVGETCHTSQFPIVNKAPTVVKTENRRIIIKLNLEYDGQEAARYYQVQYKSELDKQWLNSKLQKQLGTATNHDIDELQPGTQYTVRVLLYTNTSEVYDGMRVPELRTATTCTDPDQTYLSQKAAGTSFRVAFLNTNEELCRPLSQFKLCLWKVGDSFWTGQQRCQTLQHTVTFTNLEYYVNYTVELQKATNTISTWTIQTDEGPPERVQNIRVGKKTNTSVVLTWDDPRTSNGKIRGYCVEYFRTASHACLSTTPVEKKKNKVKVTRNSIRIDSLAPYSTYQVNIWALTTQKGDGEAYKFETNQTKNPTQQEFPTLLYLDSNKLDITLQWDCTILEGPVTFYAELACKSSWCSSTTERSQHFFHVLPNTLSFPIVGYTDYILTMYLSRNDFQISKDVSLRTPPTVPGIVRNITVYTKNTTSVGLRWLPPYPPTGEIEYYVIEYYDRVNREVIVSKISECKIWREQICHVLDASSSIVYISVSAKNINVTQFGTKSGRFSIETKEEASEAPKILSLKWDDGYNLIVQWEHPDRTNGQLLQFLIFVDNQLLSSYNITDEQLSYKQKLNIENKNLTCRQLNVEVKARNAAGNSNSIEMLIYSPPKQPKLATELRTKDMTNNSFQIVIPAILNVEGDMSNMYIVLSDTSNNQVIEREIQPFENKLINKINVPTEYSWVAGEFNLRNATNREGFSFKIGDEKESFSETDPKWMLKNRKLNAARIYKVFIVLNNTYKEFSRVMTYIIEETTLPPEFHEGLEHLPILLLIPIILCIFCVLFIWRYYKRRHHPISSSAVRVSRYISRYRRHRRNENEIHVTAFARVFVNQWTAPATIPVNRLFSYIEECISRNEFEKQFKAVPNEQTRPWINGTEAENRSKNKFTNLAAYDHTRVKLEIINRDRHSDYINANYIDGYNIEKAYIATQGPKACTVDDFWRMIWQENVEYIVVLANIVECGKTKFEKYWPELRCAKMFGSVVVEYVSAEVTAHYKIRSFDVCYNKEKRHVRQYHYVNWPEGGVPLHFKSLVPFCRKIASLLHGASPIVVHSSTGIGRTGTFILCDICLCMAKAEDKVDVFRYLQKLREQRVNMVDNVRQYILVHLILLQCLLRKDTSIACDNRLGEIVENITDANIQEEVNGLEDTIWQNKAIRDPNPKQHIVVLQEKNRFKNIVPDPSSAVQLSLYPPNKESSAYINAVLVDSYQIACKFIVTQNPLLSTVADFWRMVVENRVTIIVSLNRLNLTDPTTTIFYPLAESYIIEPLPYLEIKYINKEIKGHYEVFDLALTRLDIQENDVTLKIIQINYWGYGMERPENPSELIEVYEEMNYFGISSDKIVFTCYDGARASGLFAALCVLIDRIKLEQICDVPLAVSTVRQSRKQFVRDPSQFLFLYKCALEYVRKYDVYSIITDTN